MREDGRITLHRLHELALLYMGLAQGADDVLDEAESEEIELKLRQWQPDQDPALIHHVIREASLTFANDPTHDRLNAAADELAESFSKQVRTAIVRDLADIARADGVFDSNEMDYIRTLADVWEVNLQREQAAQGSSRH